MFTYKIELLEKGNWSELDFWVRPFYDTTTLDDSLDTGKIKLSLSTRSEAIKPFTRLRICVYDKEVLVDTIHRVVGSTRKIRRTFPNGKSLFDWEIETVELTKLLERDICDSMTVTNYLAYNYLNNAIVATPYDGTLLDNSGEINPSDQFKWEWSWGQLFTPIAYNLEMRVPILQVYYTGSGTMPYPTALYVITPSGTQFEIGQWDGTIPIINFIPTEKGQHTFVYYDPRYTTNNIYKKFNVEVVEVVQSKTDFTITDVVERLLSAGVTRRSGIEGQKYTFPFSQCEKYAAIKAPEFYFTRSTLFEALLQVGNYIHAIPRLVDINNILCVVFDELGGNTVKEIDMELVYDEQTFAIDDYCGAIDSNVDNLLNSRDKVQGAITEPSTGTYKTVRCEESKVEISADNMIVLTECPIYQVTKLEIAFEKDGFKQFDITPYLYEAAEYKTLSSYWDSAYPYAKAYALNYTQGDNKITGLNFKQFEPTDIERAWTNYAIRNIIQTVSGIDIGSSPVYPNIAFRITYIPMVNARIVQKKSYAGYPLDNTLVHNQNANTVESELYGEKMKGVIARLGNEIIRRTYYFNRYSQLPKCGELVNIDGKMMYVAIVDREFDQRLIKATITFTPNFNKLAEYVGLNSNFRLYDISEKQSVDRYVNYGEYIAIASDGFDFGSPVSPLLRNMEAFAKVFTQTAGDHNISAAVAIRADEFGNEYGNKIARPVVSFASGNSLCFAFDYADNFGAGYQSTNKYDNDKKRVQHLVRYTDVYGELEALSIEFTSKLWTASAADQTADNGNAQIYPHYTGTPVDCNFNTDGYPSSSNKYPLEIHKDSREALSVMIQLHCVALEEDIVIGAALCQNNPLITSTNSAKAAVAYYLPHRINMLNSTIDLTGAIPATYTVFALTDRMSVSMSVAAAQAKSWVLIDPTTNKLILGRNRDFAAGQYDELWLCSVNAAKMKQLQEEIE